MEWLEIIKVRTNENETETAYDKLMELVDTTPESRELVDKKVFAHASVSNDLMIALTWDTDRVRPWGSDLAEALSRELRQHGLVDHSIWVETK